MRFKKIKFSKGKVHMEYEKENANGDNDEFSFTCGDEPLKDFKGALQELDQDIRDMCELPPEYVSRITVTSVSFSYAGDDEIPGATLTGQMRLSKSNTPLNLNSPFKSFEPYCEDTQPEQLLSGECIERVKTLIIEAERYVNGERAQRELKLGTQREARA